MIDILNFKRRSYMLETGSNTVMVSMPLSIKEFNDVYISAKTPELGLKYLAYVGNVCHYGSPGNIIGLTGKELKLDILNNLGLPSDFKETNEIKKAIIHYNNHYNRGVFGLFKELTLSFDLTRSSIEVINDSLKDLLKDVKNQQKLKTDSPDAILGRIKTVMDAIGQIRNLTVSVSSDVQSLKELEGILLSEEESNIQLFGGGSIPLSSQVND